MAEAYLRSVRSYIYKSGRFFQHPSLGLSMVWHADATNPLYRLSSSTPTLDLTLNKFIERSNLLDTENAPILKFMRLRRVGRNCCRRCRRSIQKS